VFGQIVDTMIFKTTYVYNGKGLIVKEIKYFGQKQRPDLRLFSYDLNDSLILELNIDSNGILHQLKVCIFSRW